MLSERAAGDSGRTDETPLKAAHQRQGGEPDDPRVDVKEAGSAHGIPRDDSRTLDPEQRPSEGQERTEREVMRPVNVFDLGFVSSCRWERRRAFAEFLKDRHLERTPKNANHLLDTEFDTKVSSLFAPRDPFHNRDVFLTEKEKKNYPQSFFAKPDEFLEQNNFFTLVGSESDKFKKRTEVLHLSFEKRLA